MYLYTTRDVHCYFWLQEKMHCKMSVQQVSVSALHAQNFASALENQVVPKFTNRLSWTLHNICKYKGFLWSTLSRIWTESKDIYGKICIRGNPYIPLLGAMVIFRHFENRGLLYDFVVCTKIFLEVIGPYKNVKQDFSLDSIFFTGLCYRAWTSI